MYTLGKQSQEKLKNVDGKLAECFRRALSRSPVDVSAICGHRNKADQTKVFESGNSQVEWPCSKHNSFPSEAIDFQPYPMPRPKNKKFTALEKAKLYATYATFYGVMVCEASHMGIKLRGGIDWDKDGDFFDQSFDDLGHIELVS